MSGTGYHLQIRSRTRPPATNGWAWRITDDDVGGQRTMTGYPTDEAAATAGQQALTRLLNDHGPDWRWHDGVWGVQLDRGDDPTQWHTINTAETLPPTGTGLGAR